MHQSNRNLLAAGGLLKLYQRVGIGGIHHNLWHAKLKPRDLRLRTGSDKCADGGMRYLGGELAFGQGERSIDDNDLLHLAAFPASDACAVETRATLGSYQTAIRRAEALLVQLHADR